MKVLEQVDRLFCGSRNRFFKDSQLFQQCFLLLMTYGSLTMPKLREPRSRRGDALVWCQSPKDAKSAFDRDINYEWPKLGVSFSKSHGHVWCSNHGTMNYKWGCGARISEFKSVQHAGGLFIFGYKSTKHRGCA